jgi:aminoglycoside phosphotransferase (APT) family kinase protein
VPNVLALGLDQVASHLDECKPPYTMKIHGDLHLGNVLIDADREEFSLIDPRGEWAGHETYDPAYDIAKLLHERHYVGAIGACRVPHAAHSGGWLLSLAKLSHLLAIAASERASAADPHIAARATLFTGIQLISILRLEHSTSFNARALWRAGNCWLGAGAWAMADRWSLQQCADMWKWLLTTDFSDDGKAISSTVDALREMP